MGVALKNFDRETMLERVRARREPWDIVVVGGGATGVGCALDAAARGHDVLLLERDDFGKGTSSKSTKLVHGGVRYLRQGKLGVVRNSLRERARLLANAPHVVSTCGFVVPTYSRFESIWYSAGLSLYDLIARDPSFPKSRTLSRDLTRALLPEIAADRLRGGVIYHDGVFDDTRLLVDLAATAARKGAVCVNYCEVSGFTKSGSRITGVCARDRETGDEIEIAARVVVLAGGVFCDELLAMADDRHRAILAPSRGVHVVLDREFLSGETAMLVPETPDGRVLFAIPWAQKVLVGTTDVAVKTTEVDPVPTATDIDLLLETVGRYLARKPTRKDIRSTWAGLRPLPAKGAGKRTSSVSRDHLVLETRPGLVTITSGKWTTYRLMAEDAIDRAEIAGSLRRRACVTADLRIRATRDGASARSIDPGDRLHPDFDLTIADVRFALRAEMARTVEDILARRSRILFLDARAAAAMAPTIAAIIAKERGLDRTVEAAQLDRFSALARTFLPDAE